MTNTLAYSKSVQCAPICERESESIGCSNKSEKLRAVEIVESPASLGSLPHEVYFTLFKKMATASIQPYLNRINLNLSDSTQKFLEARQVHEFYDFKAIQALQLCDKALAQCGAEFTSWALKKNATKVMDLIHIASSERQDCHLNHLGEALLRYLDAKSVDQNKVSMSPDSIETTLRAFRSVTGFIEAALELDCLHAVRSKPGFPRRCFFDKEIRSINTSFEYDTITHFFYRNKINEIKISSDQNSMHLMAKEYTRLPSAHYRRRLLESYTEMHKARPFMASELSKFTDMTGHNITSLKLAPAPSSRVDSMSPSRSLLGELSEHDIDIFD